MNKDKIRFKPVTDRHKIDKDDFTTFTEGVKKLSPDAGQGIQLRKFTQNGKRTETILFRCSQADFDSISYVFESLNIKSRQKLLESILLPEIRELAKQIKANDSI
ncbi:hypothetical protein [Pseudomonas xanthosomatis]|uniref:hypothetical protein n=1 Tax=Pseudomonas xanthosomatis TaxID=2842356 RepID=UPI003518D8DD